MTIYARYNLYQPAANDLRKVEKVLTSMAHALGNAPDIELRVRPLAYSTDYRAGFELTMMSRETS